MTPEQLANVEEAAAHCLERFDHSHLPFATVAQYIDRLKVDPAWSDHEIIEMQTLVINILLNERRRGTFNG